MSKVPSQKWNTGLSPNSGGLGKETEAGRILLHSECLKDPLTSLIWADVLGKESVCHFHLKTTLCAMATTTSPPAQEKKPCQNQTNLTFITTLKRFQFKRVTPQGWTVGRKQPHGGMWSPCIPENSFLIFKIFNSDEREGYLVFGCNNQEAERSN